jgi:hypothetical protein
LSKNQNFTIEAGKASKKSSDPVLLYHEPNDTHDAHSLIDVINPFLEMLTKEDQFIEAASDPKSALKALLSSPRICGSNAAGLCQF